MFVRLEIRDQDVTSSSFIASNVLKVDQLLPGYKTVPLVDWSGHPIPFASLFVHLSFFRNGQEVDFQIEE
jgi:hypothetical protein